MNNTRYRLDSSLPTRDYLHYFVATPRQTVAAVGLPTAMDTQEELADLQSRFDLLQGDRKGDIRRQDSSAARPPSQNTRAVACSTSLMMRLPPPRPLARSLLRAVPTHSQTK